MNIFLRVAGWIGLAMMVVLIGLAAVVWDVYWHPFGRDATAQRTVLHIPRQAGVNAVVDRLVQQHGLRQPWVLRAWLRYTGADRQIKPGEVRIDPRWNLKQLTMALIRGPRVEHRITFIPGIRMRQVLAQLARVDNIRHMLPPDIPDERLQKKLGWQYPPEGMILPETYFYRAGDTDVAILQRAHRALWQYLKQAWPHRKRDLPLKTPYEALILASIVEKETGQARERPMIAGVFIRRLQRGMRLQSDPTTIYGMGARFQGNLTRADLREATPYNTYRIQGLPPTPIALASKAAIDAVLHPAEGDALYFVAKGDGTHHFSATLEEHNAAVRRYQLKQGRAGGE